MASSTLAAIGEEGSLSFAKENVGPDVVTLKEAVKKGNSFLQWAENLLKKGRFEESAQNAENALQCFRAAFSDLSRDEILANFDGSPDAIMKFIDESEDNEGLADSLMGEARALLFRSDLPQAEHQSSIADLDFAIAVFEKLGDGIGQMKCFRVLGGLKMKAGDIDEARRYLNASLILSQQSRGERKSISLDEARTHVLLGELCLRAGDDRVAEDHYARALGRLSKVTSEGDLRRKAFALFGVGQIKMKQGDDDTAGELFQESVEIFESLNCDRDKMEVLLALANLQLKLHVAGVGAETEEEQLEMLETVEMDYLFCYEYFKSDDSEVARDQTASIATSLGIIKTMVGETEAATEYFEIALEMYEKLGNEKGMEKTVALMNNLNAISK